MNFFASRAPSRVTVQGASVLDALHTNVMLADASKLGQKSAFFFGEVADLSCLITDAAADSGFTDALEAKGVEVRRGE